MPDTNNLATAMDEIRERPQAVRNFDPWTMLAAAQYDNRRLLAVADAVLALHVPFDRQQRQFCAVHGSSSLPRPLWERAVNRCRDCREVTRQVCAGCGSPCADVAWPCATVLNVSRALTGESGTDA